MHLMLLLSMESLSAEEDFGMLEMENENDGESESETELGLPLFRPFTRWPNSFEGKILPVGQTVLKEI